MTITWPVFNGKPAGTVLRSSSWNTVPGFIADQTRSGKFKTRISHIHAPDEFNVLMHMTLPEYRVFNNWWRNSCRKGVYTFAYPKINDNTGVLAEYQFCSNSRLSVKNTSGDNLEISMQWVEVT
jgi:hypothetical protein